MTPSFLFAELYIDETLSRVANSALPCAPVRPHVERWSRARRVSSALRAPFSS
jgi:hypothetical protein